MGFSAVLYSILESCRRRGIEPYTYLKDILTRLPRMTMSQLPSLTPAAWAQTQSVAHQIAS
jgi:transposase